MELWLSHVSRESQPVKRIKRVVHFIITLFWRYWTIYRHQINSISVDDIAFSVVFTCRRSMSIGDSWPVEEVTKNIFSTNNTFHSIIMMISVVLCKISEEMNYVSIFHNQWQPCDCTIDRQNYRKSSQKFVATDIMLGIYSLIWAICHKLMGFYRNAVLFHIIFIVTHGEIFSHLGHTGPLTVNKMALPSMYRQRWCQIHALIGRNTIALRV